jgi:hypothetical protein
MFSSTVTHLLPQEKGQVRKPLHGDGAGHRNGGQLVVEVGLIEPFRVDTPPLQPNGNSGQGLFVGNGEHDQRAAGDFRVPGRVLNRGVR